MLIPKLKRHALHEAAHAVMMVFLRIENMQNVNIIPRHGVIGVDPFKLYGGGVKRGWTFYDGVCADPDSFPKAYVVQSRIHTRKLLLMVLAGPAGDQRRLDGTDKTQAVAYTKALAKKRHREMLLRYERLCERLVTGILAPAIAAFAELLYERKTIDGGDAEEIIQKLLGIDDPWRIERESRIHKRCKGKVVAHCK